ncbi:MAG: phosphatase PAP2 family protein [Planctomycetota bacterium]|jgi:hypothetical protein
MAGPTRVRRVLATTCVLLCLVAGGCATLPDGSRWGEDALWPVDGSRVARAARKAFLSPNTLIPLAGAAVFAIDDFDERASDWAVKHNPVFDSDDNARDWSDDLKDILKAEAFVTAMATPSGPDTDEWLLAKLKGGSVELVAVGVTHGMTNGLKSAIDRDRPDSSNDNSFPSGHSSSAFSYATLSNRNLNSIEMPGALRTGLKATNVTLASGVAWARVEGKRHYPSDVLFGAALGHFLTAFIHDAFMNLPEDSKVDFAIVPTDGGAALEVSFSF